MPVAGIKSSNVLALISTRLGQIIALTCVLTTLVVNPWSNYDPISLPKMVIMSGGAFSVAAIVLLNKKIFSNRLNRSSTFTFSLFVLGLIIPLLFSGAPIAQQIWGVFGRNTGLLTYLSLLALMLGAIVVQSQDA